MTETQTITESLERFIEEKGSIAAREAELLSGLKAALNRLGYDLRPLETAPPAVQGRRAGASSPSSPARRRGRPRSKPLDDGAAQHVEDTLIATTEPTALDGPSVSR